MSWAGIQAIERNAKAFNGHIVPRFRNLPRSDETGRHRRGYKTKNLFQVDMPEEVIFKLSELIFPSDNVTGRS
jgi:hypothetical protein